MIQVFLLRTRVDRIFIYAGKLEQFLPSVLSAVCDSVNLYTCYLRLVAMAPLEDVVSTCCCLVGPISCISVRREIIVE